MDAYAVEGTPEGLLEANEMESDPSSLFRIGTNVHAIAKASHAAIIIDYANYYQALYEAIAKARHSIFVVGWDIDSRIKLLRGERIVGAEHPVRFFDLIQWKAQQEPQVQIYLNRWDYSLFMAKDRELLGKLRWYRHSPPNLHYWQDSTVPSGACHHQKIVIVDDEVAFCGGMDIALKRWDDRDHSPSNHNRIDAIAPGVSPLKFEPYHDTQLLVSGEAAQQLALIARERWHLSAESDTLPLRPLPEQKGLPAAWPDSFAPDFQDVTLGIALTAPQWGELPPKRQIEQLYIDMIGRAERFIYMENQFFTCPSVAKALNKRLHEKPELQVLLISSCAPAGIIERKSMWPARLTFRDILVEGGVGDRVVMAYPVSRVAGKEKPVRIHSKLTAVDDLFLRVGSSNINIRSMQLDTECDLVIEGDNSQSRATVAAIRDDLIREHTGHEMETINRVARGELPVERLLTYLSHSRQHLYKINDEHYRYEPFARLAVRVADPSQPILPLGVSMAIAKMKVVRVVLVVLFIAALALLWKVTPLARYATPETIIPLLEQVRNTPWAVPAAIVAYTLGTLAFFPHMAMTGTIVVVFSPIQAFTIAMTGSLISGSIGFWAGKKLGMRTMRTLVGETAEKVSLYAKKGGIVGITLLRMLPVAPYTAVNMALGMLEVPFMTFLIGTFLGTLPGTVIAAYLGQSMLELWQNPNMENLGIIAIGAACWFAVIMGSHFAARQWRKKRGVKTA